MKELSLHVLDVAQNSITAGANLIEILISEIGNERIFQIVDNGCGMSEEMVQRVIDPFTTTRTTRRVGLGLPLLKMAAEQTGGSLEVKSKQGEGTTVKSVFYTDNIDCMPLGDISGTMALIIQGLPQSVNLVYKRIKDETGFTVDTRELREILGEQISFAEPEIAIWISEYIRENESTLS
ncbi:MAG: ATP-binding protein [Clostridia bacterium]|nr:ATP-binding protein [Clostridia bacterium]